MKRFLIPAVFCSACFLTACFSVNLPRQEIRETRTFDLTLPSAPQKFTYRVEIVPFLSESPAKFKMLYRSGSELKMDEYNKWSQTPSRMLTRFFRSAFISDVPAPLLVLRGKILTFEVDAEMKSACLAVSYSVSREGAAEPFLNQVLKTSVPMGDVSASSFAQAMSKAASVQAGELKQKIEGALRPK